MKWINSQCGVNLIWSWLLRVWIIDNARELLRYKASPLNWNPGHMSPAPPCPSRTPCPYPSGSVAPHTNLSLFLLIASPPDIPTSKSNVIVGFGCLINQCPHLLWNTMQHCTLTVTSLCNLRTSLRGVTLRFQIVLSNWLKNSMAYRKTFYGILDIFWWIFSECQS